MNRNKGDWHKSIEACGVTNYVVDSWNNIEKYKKITDSIFIFDEQRVVGYGKWSRSFILISKKNDWILLSATPGDEWKDYIPVFIANGFYPNKSMFTKRHVVYDPYVPFPKILHYIEEDILEEYRSQIQVPMKDNRHTKRHRKYVYNRYDYKLYSDLLKNRFNWIKDQPIETPSEFSQLARRITAESEDRKSNTLDIIKNNDKIIIFYNFNYELEILKELATKAGKKYYQYNGKKHELLDDDELEWVYLVQYNSGAEGWNCITTNVILFYSPNHSYKKMEQAEGRIDRINTPYVDLMYYYMTSNAKVDKDILKAISSKKRFNETNWGKKYITVKDYYDERY